MQKEWIQKYESLRPTFVEFTKQLSEMLEQQMREIPHVLQARTKKVDSFAKKAARPDKNYEKFDEVTDLTGLRVLTYSLEDAAKVRTLVEKEFKVDWSNTVDKGRELEPKQLGYNSINYVVSVPESKGSLFTQFGTLKAEIQVHTLLSHVWSEIQHPLYKGETSVPSGLARRLFLVRGLLEVADLELQDFKDREAEISAAISRDLKTKAVVNLSTTALYEYIETSDLVQELITSASTAGFDVMSSLEEPLSVVSDLADACLAVGIHTTDQLEQFITEFGTKSKNFLHELNTQIRKKRNVPWSVGGAYLIVFLLMAAFPGKLNEEYFTKRGWSSKTVNLIRSVPPN